MNNSNKEPSKRLDDALAQWRALPKPKDANKQLIYESMLLLGEVFMQAPLGTFDALLDRGLALADFVHHVSDEKDEEVDHARLMSSGLREIRAFREDPGDRLKALMAPTNIFLTHGMMEDFALCIYAVGDAQQQLERFMDASISYRTALSICEKLGLRQYVPALQLSVAQMFRYESVRGRIDWETTLSYFNDCYASLDSAPIEERERNKLRAACLIDRAPCYVEIPRENLQRGAGSAVSVREGIARARRDTNEGIGLAKKAPELGQYVRQGEINLLRLDQAEDASN